MAMTPGSLPPLSALRSFAAAARHESYRLAAAELGVTPSAVSHQVKALELWIGAPLFVRVGRDVRLSTTGAFIAAKVTEAFDLLAQSFDSARRQASDNSLRVSALPLFTQAWLIPRLGRFERAHPAITIAIDTTSRLADFDSDPVDVAIRNSAKPGGGLTARKLLDLRAIPLCTPQVADRIERPGDLSKVALIHLSVGSEGWRHWLERAGVGGLRAKSNLIVDTMPAALEAAAAGHGVMLGLHPLVWDMPIARRLVVPLNKPDVSGGAYYAVHRKADAARAPVRLFVAWLLAEMREDRGRLRRLPRKKDAPR